MVTNNYKMALLPAYYYRAIELRYEGRIYRDIKEILAGEYGADFAEPTIRKWFARGGVLHDYYLQYADEMNELAKREAIDILKGNVKDAVKVLGTVMTNKTAMDSARVNAAKEFLNRALGPVPTKHKGDPITKNVITVNDIDINAIGTVDFLRLLKRMEQLKNAGPIDN